MLSRTAAHLYWIGRYMERAEFATRLIEATIRLAALGDHEESEQAWRSALSVVGAASSFRATGETHTPANVRRFLPLSEANSSSVRTCLAQARENAREILGAFDIACEPVEVISGARQHSSPVQDPSVFRAAALARIHHQRALLQRHAREASRHDADAVAAAKHERSQIDVTGRDAGLDAGRAGR